MGTTTILDILGSVIIGGIILVNILNLNENVVNNSFFYGSNKNSQIDLVIIATTIDRDFNLIGYCGNINSMINDSTIIYGDSSSIKFLSDYDNNGTYDTIYYFLSDTAALSHTQNPNDKILYRKINNQDPLILGNNLIEFKLSYLDGLMNEISSPIFSNSNVNFIRISVRLESSYSIGGAYSDAIWKRMTVTSKNNTKS